MSPASFSSSYSPEWNHQKPSGRVFICSRIWLSLKWVLPSIFTWAIATRRPSSTSKTTRTAVESFS